MDIGKFLSDYTKATSAKIREEMIKKHVVATYIPYEVKISESEKIIELSTFKEVNEKRVFWINTPIRYMLLVKAVIMSYTDLEWDETNFVLQFNLLEQYGIFEKIIDVIGSDYERFQTVLNMTLDDMMTNQRSLISYLDNLKEAVSTTLDELNDAIAEGIKNIPTEETE